MKQLFALVAILFVVGVAGFLYRNTVERPGVTSPVGACTAEAKICPDGSSVGRQGPSCEFAPCLLPNVEVPEAGISFVIPNGYAADENAYGADMRLIAAFVKPSLSESVSHSIVIYRYEIPEGETAEQVILANTRYQPADMQAEDFSRFETVSIGSKSFRRTVIERFEAQVHTAYFLVRESDVLRFEVMERDVTGWMEPTLSIDSLPEHQALRALLQALQSTP